MIKTPCLQLQGAWVLSLVWEPMVWLMKWPKIKIRVMVIIFFKKMVVMETEIWIELRSIKETEV